MKIKDDIIKQLHDLMEGPLWLDESFKKKLSNLPEELAFGRPIPEIHSVAELLSHLTVWLNACLDRMNCIPNELKDNDENDWKTNEILSAKGWTEVKEEFFKAHKRVMEFADTCDDAFLEKNYPSSVSTGFTNKDIFFGLIHHDAYHMGQIGITIKLLKAQSKTT